MNFKRQLVVLFCVTCISMFAIADASWTSDSDVISFVSEQAELLPQSVEVSSGLDDIDLWNVKFPAEAAEPCSQSSEAANIQVLSSGQDSLDMCLSAIVTLSLGASFSWVKKQSFGFVPGWYHSGGPSQIGHSYAVVPELVFAEIPCFVQPTSDAADDVLQYNFGLRAEVPLWSKTEFVSSLYALRGPPDIS